MIIFLNIYLLLTQILKNLLLYLVLLIIHFKILKIQLYENFKIKTFYIHSKLIKYRYGIHQDKRDLEI